MPTEISGSTGVNKIQDGTVVVADLASGSTMTSNVPMFRAKLSNNQTVNQGSYAQITMNSETFDTDNWYDTSAYRYTPQKAGYYQFHGQVAAGTGSLRALYLIFKKNGSTYSGTNLYADNNSWDDMSLTHTDLIYMNGSSDYVEIFAKVIDNASSTDILFYDQDGGSLTFWTGFLVREG